MELSQFEQSLMTSNVINLHALTKAAPLKTPEERRAEWLQQRRGRFTASEFYRLMAYPNKTELPEGAKTYALEKAVELLTEMDEAEKFISIDMQWGIDHEVEAITAFTEKTGLEVLHIGDQQKIITLGDDISGTPDGLIGNDSGIEIKCQKSKNHFKNMLMQNGDDLKAQCPDYYWQIQGCMHITGRNSWHFVSYDPRFYSAGHRLHTFVVYRNDEDLLRLEERLLQAIVYRNGLLLEVKK